jgi:hypothetical protein
MTEQGQPTPKHEQDHPASPQAPAPEVTEPVTEDVPAKDAEPNPGESETNPK